jgi:hypothetical protein
MLSHNEGWKWSARPGLRLFTVLCLLFLAVAPATAQLDPGTRWALVTGHWSRGAADTVACLDLDTWKLVTQFDGSTAVADPSPKPWIPVVGDWEGSGVDTVKMFDSHTWKLVDAADGPLTASAEPEPEPWVPVAGDWDGRGVDTVRVVDLRDRSVHKLEEGPIPVERYEPEPDPWRPVVGKWDGRVDAIAWVHTEGAFSAWQAVAGDWDGAGIDTVAAVHSATGELVRASETAPARSLSIGGGGGGCYTVIKNQTDIVKVFYGLDGSVTVIHIKMHELWTCCPVAPYGPYVCSMKLVAG